jgi:hypothetical protein
MTLQPCSYHYDCIFDWLSASGKRSLRRQRREGEGGFLYAVNPAEKITNFPMLCPCCRQNFIERDDSDESGDLKDNNEEEEEEEIDDREEDSGMQQLGPDIVVRPGARTTTGNVSSDENV